jgi:predicted negative regulator of RcsB-dependent stress response
MAGTVTTSKRNGKALALGIAALLVLGAVIAGGAYWWNQRNAPSQASAADCALAQKIVDEAQKLSGDKAAVEKWEKETTKLRYARMKDGYLSAQIAQYAFWAASHALGKDDEVAPPKKQAEMRDTANSHCTEAKRTLAIPPIGS